MTLTKQGTSALVINVFLNNKVMTIEGFTKAGNGSKEDMLKFLSREGTRKHLSTWKKRV
jgi:hypothetical protein